MDEIDLLKWAVGSKALPPEWEPKVVDEDRLLLLIAQHRLSGRFLQRVRKERPRWCSRRLLFSAWKQQEYAKQNLKYQLEAAHEAVAALRSNDFPLVTVKGFSTYALTGADQNIRYCGDLDVFFGDLELLWNTFEALGYTGKRVSHGVHEWAKMHRGQAFFEFHQYFPVYSYAGNMGTADLVPMKNPGRWIQSFPDIQEGKIRYEDLVEILSYGITSETKGLAVPDPAMSAFIICAHVFKHYTIVPPDNGSPIISLGELADLCDLVEHPKFDGQRFLSLARTFDGSDSLKFVAYLVRRFFGYNPLPLPDLAEVKDFSFPRCLTWWKCWAVCNSADDLLIEEDRLPIIHALGTNTIVAARGSEQRQYGLFTDSGAEELTRAIVHATQYEPFPLKLAVSWGETSLTFELTALRRVPSEDCDYHVEIRGDRDFHEYSANIGSLGVELEHVGIDNVSMSEQEDGYTVRIWVPWDILPADYQSCGTISVLLVVAMRDRAKPSRSSFDPCVVIPLTIVLGEPL